MGSPDGNKKLMKQIFDLLIFGFLGHFIAKDKRYKRKRPGNKK
jgi:hypothetical protein